MPGKYKIRAQIILHADVEPDGYLAGIEDEVLDYEDMSSWDAEGVRASGGDVSFEVEADSEDEAREKANNALSMAYYSGDSGIEWEIEDIDISDVEEIEPPMDLEKALVIIRAYFGTAEGLTDEQRAAFIFLLERITP